MSEPTPLSAEQPYSRDELVHLAENMRHPTVQQIVGATGQKTINRLSRTTRPASLSVAAVWRMLATIDAQAATVDELQREIEGYRQMLERTVEALNAENARERRQHPDPQFASMVRDLGKRIGYGVLMTEASRLWAEEVGGGAFAVGHCISIVEAADREARRVLAGKEAQDAAV